MSVDEEMGVYSVDCIRVHSGNNGSADCTWMLCPKSIDGRREMK